MYIRVRYYKPGIFQFKTSIQNKNVIKSSAQNILDNKPTKKLKRSFRLKIFSTYSRRINDHQIDHHAAKVVDHETQSVKSVKPVKRKKIG